MRILFVFLLGLILVQCQSSLDTSDGDQLQKKETTQKDQSNDIDIEQRLNDMGVILPSTTPPQANYVNAVRTGNLVFLAGKGPKMPDGAYMTGKVGQDLTIEQAYAGARQVAILQLAALKDEIGDLNKVKRIVKVLGMVNCGPDFANQPEVINGFSDFMVEVFGDRGKHARAAVGMIALPRNICVEIEMIVEIY